MPQYKIKLYKALTFYNNQPPVQIYYIKIYDLIKSGSENIPAFKTPKKAINYFNKLFSFKIKLKDFIKQENNDLIIYI